MRLLQISVRRGFEATPYHLLLFAVRQAPMQIDAQKKAGSRRIPLHCTGFCQGVFKAASASAPFRSTAAFRFRSVTGSKRYGLSLDVDAHVATQVRVLVFTFEVRAAGVGVSFAALVVIFDVVLNFIGHGVTSFFSSSVWRPGPRMRSPAAAPVVLFSSSLE
jgi:hypothetical protein